MNPITQGLVLAALALVVVDAWAGNRSLMEQNARELVEINRAVLESLKANSEDGEYRLTARVVEENGKRVIKVDHFERVGPVAAKPEEQATSSSSGPTQEAGDAKAKDQNKDQNKDQKKSVLAPYGEHEPFVRFGPVTEPGPVLAPDASAGTAPAPALATPHQGERRRVEALLTSHPQLKVIELSEEDLNKLTPFFASIRPGSGAALLLW